MNFLKSIISILLLATLALHGSEIGIGTSFGYGKDTEVQPLGSTYNLNMTSYDIDFYADIEISNPQTPFAELLAFIISPASYRVSYRYDLLNSDLYFDTDSSTGQSKDALHSLNFTILYNAIDYHGYFLDGGLGVGYIFKIDNLASSSNFSIHNDTKRIWLLWEIGLGKTWSNFSIRYSLSDMRFFYNATSSNLAYNSSASLLYPLRSKISFIYWF